MSPARLLAAVLAAVFAPAASASAVTPSVVGWPVVTPAGELLPGVGGDGAVVNAITQGVLLDQVLAAYRADLRRRWSRSVDLGDHRDFAAGPVIRANADGSYGPVGVLGRPGSWNVDPAGGLVPACWGPVLSDGSCIETRLAGGLSTPQDPLQYVVLRRSASGAETWRVQTGSCCDELRLPVLDDAGTVYSSLPGTGAYRLLAVDPDAGGVRWQRDVPGPILTALNAGVLTTTSRGVEATAGDGTARWSASLTGGRATVARVDRRRGEVMVQMSTFSRSRVHALSQVSGRVRWSRPGRLVGVGPSGLRYVASDDLTLQGVAPDGGLRWSRTFFGRVEGAREQRDGTLLVSVGTDLGLLYRLDPRRSEPEVTRSSVAISTRRPRVAAFDAPGCLVGGGTVLRLRLAQAAAGRVGYRSGFYQSGPERRTIDVVDRFRLPAGTHHLLVPVAEGRRTITVDWRENGRLVVKRFAVTGVRCPA